MRIVKGGGYPIFRWTPRIVRWGDRISLFWFGVELVYIP